MQRSRRNYIACACKRMLPAIKSDLLITANPLRPRVGFFVRFSTRDFKIKNPYKAHRDANDSRDKLCKNEPPTTS